MFFSSSCISNIQLNGSKARNFRQKHIPRCLFLHESTDVFPRSVDESILFASYSKSVSFSLVRRISSVRGTFFANTDPAVELSSLRRKCISIRFFLHGSKDILNLMLLVCCDNFFRITGIICGLLCFVWRTPS